MDAATNRYTLVTAIAVVKLTGGIFSGMLVLSKPEIHRTEKLQMLVKYFTKAAAISV